MSVVPINPKLSPKFNLRNKKIAQQGQINLIFAKAIAKYIVKKATATE